VLKELYTVHAVAKWHQP